MKKINTSGCALYPTAKCYNCAYSCADEGNEPCEIWAPCSSISAPMPCRCGSRETAQELWKEYCLPSACEDCPDNKLK